MDLSDNWEDAAYDQRWKDAVALFVFRNRFDKPTLWTTVKAVVNTSLPPNRKQLRARTSDVLFAIGRLVREGRILGATYHPELAPDRRIHELFLRMGENGHG